ncbi:MAG: hypothetical protein SH819_03100 [Cytophagales bacterium]|nr:hypothetical protein [Cytophagales bacterium]
MSKLKLFTVAVAGLLVLNLALLTVLLVRPAPRPPQQGPERERPKQIIIQRLQLDGDQVKKYERLINEHQSAIQVLDEEVRTAKNSLYRILRSGETAEKDSLIGLLGQLQQKTEATHFDHFMLLRALCRPEQLPLFEEMASDLAHIFESPKNGRPPRD